MSVPGASTSTGMKTFRLYLGESGLVTTLEVTSEHEYKTVVGTVSQLRQSLLTDPVLRQPLLQIFDSVYKDDSQFPNHLKKFTPLADQISNKSKIQQIRTIPPNDNDVLDFLTNTFPDLYLRSSRFRESDILWGETIGGRQSADKEEISINLRLVQLWLQSLSQPTDISSVELTFLFTAVFLHELAHSALVWYGEGACNSPKLGGIDEEAGEFYEKRVFGGVSTCEITKKDLKITDVGFYKGTTFYLIDDKQAAELLRFDTRKGLPLIDISSLSPAPPVSTSKFHGKMILSRFRTAASSSRQVEGVSMNLKSSTHFYPTLKGDKKYRML